jgi:nitroreductase
MTNDTFSILTGIIKSRRSIGWKNMNGRLIPDEMVNSLFALADWAPTHGRTEPWHFFVYTGNALKQFGQIHADLYKQHTAPEKFLDATYEKLLHNVDKASHLVIAAMKRGTNPKIPQLEEVAAASAAIENMLLGATALGIASFWSTGGMTHTHALKDHLQLSPDDIILGLVFLGYTDEPAKEGVRNKPLAEKITWM